MSEPNRLLEAAVPNTFGSVPQRPVASEGRANALDLDDPDDLDLEALDDGDIPDDTVAAQGISAAELDRRINESVRMTLADQSATVATAKRRGRIGFVAGLLMAAVGVPLFFGRSLLSEEIGIALICLGIGVALLSVLLASLRAEVAASRQSTATAVTNTLFLPHTAIGWLVALGLVAFGLLVLLAAAQTG